MRRLIAMLALAAGASLPVAPVLAQSAAPAGRLTCTIGAGLAQAVATQKPLDCRFRPRRGPLQTYTGVIRGFALDARTVGRSLLAWRVYGPYARAPLGVLYGPYVRKPGEVALTGSHDGDVRLVPRALPIQRGANVALGVTAFELSLVRSPRKR
ncbi:DUF992 domain-containing protein [Bosea sp. (in: a-proteobacteria)]|uniref:DUF992 domain-containing protein n=1 Tax=Bosea sp. (in: a-proteobacteria) TaxID=1871050 RepID=UPI002DDD8B96|nr:DUF992 domain-containing protein [Bosea sp. (in: a-proteobacteria)]HEV2512546.1 DUF992 domain-containing protein [Bosea sp. (in: a-proteobacteria)]